jgi:hypothetical protein
MKKLLLACLCASLMVLGTWQVSRADLINGSFDASPNFTGWTLGAPANYDVTGAFNSFGSPPFFAVDGDGAFARLASNAGVAMISQQLSVLKGEMLSGFAAFITPEDGSTLPDGSSTNDNAFVNILDTSNNLVSAPLFLDALNTLNYPSFFRDPDSGFGYSMSWQQWTWLAPASATYSLQLGVANVADSLTSFALFDGNSISPVPEPATMFLLGCGLGGLIVFRKRFSIASSLR